MGVLDKFLNAMKMNDDDGFGDDYLDDEYDDYADAAEERPKKRLLSKYNDDEFDDMPPQPVAVPQERQPAPKPKAVPKPQPKSKVSPMRSAKRGSGMEAGGFFHDFVQLKAFQISVHSCFLVFSLWQTRRAKARRISSQFKIINHPAALSNPGAQMGEKWHFRPVLSCFLLARGGLSVVL